MGPAPVGAKDPEKINPRRANKHPTGEYLLRLIDFVKSATSFFSLISLMGDKKSFAYSFVKGREREGREGDVRAAYEILLAYVLFSRGVLSPLATQTKSRNFYFTTFFLKFLFSAQKKKLKLRGFFQRSRFHFCAPCPAGAIKKVTTVQNAITLATFFFRAFNENVPAYTGTW